MQIIKCLSILVLGLITVGCNKEKQSVYTGNITINSTVSLDAYPDLTELKKIEGNLIIENKSIDTETFPFTKLEEVTGNLTVNSDHSFRSHILPRIKTIGGDCTLRMGLSSFLDFSSLEQIGGKLAVFRGFNKDEEAGYNFSNLQSVKEIRIGHTLFLLN